MRETTSRPFTDSRAIPQELANGWIEASREPGTLQAVKRANFRSTVRRSLRRRLWYLLDGPEFERKVLSLARDDRVSQYLVVGDESRLTIAPDAAVNDALFNVLSGTIVVEAAAFFGHRVSILTGTHDISRRGIERQRAYPRAGRDIVIGPGAWVASNATVLGPAVIGAGAVVAAGAVVIGDVAPGLVVAGVPARVVGSVPDEPAASE